MKAIHFTREELETRSAISEADIAIAVEFWKHFSVALFRGILDGSRSGIMVEWDVQKRTYIYSATGHTISALEIRNRVIEPFLNNVKFAMRSVSEKLQRKEITLSEWQREQMYLIKYSQICCALVANGGNKNNTQNDYLTIVAFILALFLFFQNFAIDIESGKQTLGGSLLTRTDLYAEAGRDAYEEMRRYVFEFYLGTKEERRVLGIADHCHTVGDWIGCPELAAMGWQPIGTLPRLTDTPCRSRCKCSWEFR